MNLEFLKKSRTSMLVTGLLVGALSISACQQEPEPEPSLEDNISAEQSIAMSAEPAETSATVVDDATLNEVQDDTIANVNTDVTQMTYLCSPALKVEATYKEESNTVVLGTDMGTVTLDQTNTGTNPEVFEVDTALDGSNGITEWRTAHGERESGVMRTASDDESNMNTYECNRAG